MEVKIATVANTKYSLKLSLNSIIATTAGMKCQWRPAWGDVIRINCPHWMEIEAGTDASEL